jgi:signal transduction histidine kinase
MNTKPKDNEPESPAHRLEILYMYSMSAIIVLSTLSQAFILHELSWHSSQLRSISRLAGNSTIDRPLSLAALSMQAAGNADERREPLDTLQRALSRSRNDALPSPAMGASPKVEKTERMTRSLFAPQEPHSKAAIRAAEELVATSNRDPSKAPPAGVVGPLVRTIVDEENLARQAASETVTRAGDDAADHVIRLEKLECLVFIFLTVVLFLEGAFVIRPAAQKIRRFMNVMQRSNEATKVYAAKLERSNKELQDFASVASHDLQEPLRKVQAFSDRLKTRSAAGLDDSGRDYLDRIQNAARRMQTLINDLLTFSRVATKAQPFEPVDLTSATRDVLADLEVRIEQTGGHVDLGDLPTVEADPLQVRQLMQNLIGNALKYHRTEEPPVVKVTGSTLAPEPNGETEAGRELCQILIEDNGIGFEQIYAERIFTIFQRLHGRNEYEGTGVGLAVCRKIVERHGGSIKARSAPGQGSTFLVTLPVRQPKEECASVSSN